MTLPNIALSISGLPGSGKSTFLRDICFDESCERLSHAQGIWDLGEDERAIVFASFITVTLHCTHFSEYSPVDPMAFSNHPLLPTLAKMAPYYIVLFLKRNLDKVAAARPQYTKEQLQELQRKMLTANRRASNTSGYNCTALKELPVDW